MSASSSAASSTLTRARFATIGLVVVATATAGYLWYRSHADGLSQDTGLHRSNAVHRRRRRAAADQDAAGQDEPGIFVDDAVENNGEGQLVSTGLMDGETVIDDPGFDDEYQWTNLLPSYQRNGQNIVQLLFRVSEDATRRNAYVHRGCGCNGCNMLPIRGIRYRCANCADYDLCEGCEAQGLHTKTHIFYKIRVPAPSFGVRHILPVYYAGNPDTAMRQVPKEVLLRLSRETGFERPELDAYWEQWMFMANSDWRDDPDEIHLVMNRATFERCLVPTGSERQSPPSLIFDRMFAFYDYNRDGYISFPEFLHGIAWRRKRDKWRRIFDSYDIDADGYVSRKDFLRIFRSYYVLHRQLQKVMMETAEEAQMHSKGAHDLISGRQPLSRGFGPEGHYPRAPDPRTGEGKTVRADGDLEITDGKGIVAESGNDTGNREDVIARDLHPSRMGRWDQPGRRYSAAYWETIVDPPQTVDQMPDVLSNFRRTRSQEAEILGQEPDDEPAAPGSSAAEMDADSDHHLSNPESDRAWLPAYVTVTTEDVEAIDGPGTTIESVRRESRRAVIQHAILRERAHEDIRRRWRRRQFYTDEEEGAQAPADWDDADDVLVRNGRVGESSTAPSRRPTIHSRSSSKVRFVEDRDDFDTRSNPSTSSRSVPERWGGVEIPDAERDAGKEILYQVAQQAFNELLDPLFKHEEDLVEQLAVHTPEMEKWRDLYTSPEFEVWALSQETGDGRVESTLPPRVSSLSSTFMRPPHTEVLIEPIRHRPLEDLLAASGYEVDASLLRPGDAGLPESPAPSSTTSTARASPTSAELLPVVAEGRDGQASSPSPSSPAPAPAPGPSPPRPGSHGGSYRDPTLPQFRPDAAARTATPRPAGGVDDGARVATPAPAPALQRPAQELLYELWRLERARRKAEARGGWGRLRFEEFEAKVKGMFGQGKGSQMDYLGSWIEFCIP